MVALINPLIHVKGYASAETRAAVERADFLIDQAGELGEPVFLLLFHKSYFTLCGLRTMWDLTAT